MGQYKETFISFHVRSDLLKETLLSSSVSLLHIAVKTFLELYFDAHSELMCLLCSLVAKKGEKSFVMGQQSCCLGYFGGIWHCWFDVVC